ncbi:MAG TPA: hypothetical protein VN775_08970 [Opitutaceae bacterium]|nr:hypothetical protein [Opitutaceae bacterium]
MNKRLLPLLSAACLICLCTLNYSSLAQTTPVPTTLPGEPGGQQRPLRGRHPAIRAAIGALERAKADMQAAAHDFGGHRVDAIAACDAAIAQLRLALQYANANQPNPGEPPAPPSTQ